MSIEPMMTKPTYNDLAEEIVTAQLPCFEFEAFDGDFPKVQVRMSKMRYAIEAGDGRFGRRCFYTVSRGKYELAERLEKMAGHYMRSIGGRFLTPLYHTSKKESNTKNKKAGVPIPTYHCLADKLIASLDCGESVNGHRVSSNALLLQGGDERTNIHVSVMEEIFSDETGAHYYTVKLLVGNSPKSFWFIDRIAQKALPIKLAALAKELLRRGKKHNCGLTEIYAFTGQKESYAYQETYDDLANELVADLGHGYIASSTGTRSSVYMSVLSTKSPDTDADDATVSVRISQEIPYSYNQEFDRYTIEIASGRYSYELFYTKSLDRGELAAKLEEVVKEYSAKAKGRGCELVEVYASAADQDFESTGA